MLQRIIATIATTLMGWFVWWFLGGPLLVGIGYSLGGFAVQAIGIIFWTVAALMPLLIWRRLRPIVGG